MRTTISIYRQLGKWIESVDAAYAAAHPELLAAMSTLTDPSTTTSETPAHSSTASFASANTSTSTQRHLYFHPTTTLLFLSHEPTSLASPSPRPVYRLPLPLWGIHWPWDVSPSAELDV